MSGFKCIPLYCGLMAAAAMSCVARDESEGMIATLSCDDAHVREVVEGFGDELQRVSRQARDSVRVTEIRDAYSPYVTRELLATWTSEPSRAPGRDVSSPWPERIELRAVRAEGPATCRVEGDIVYATSTGEIRNRTPVRILVQHADGWRIGEFEAEAADADSTTGAAAADVLRRFYAAINARDFAAAYALREDGATPRRTLDQFAAGFAEIVRSDIEIGRPGRIEGAAGSRYVKVPVVVRATTSSGEEQRFEGTYTLRRSVVDGTSGEARGWRIYDAELVRAR
ncbi:MAG TPA: hypothetical protein VJ802_07080 [Gemmatimonadaceae bacterium]|nr:hypothetical protein [Gemmatimonadaceae bacterium]